MLWLLWYSKYKKRVISFYF